jgi:protein-disulfide isomerase
LFADAALRDKGAVMKFRQTVMLFAILCAGSVGVYSQTKPASAKEETEKIVRDYILKNPEIIREALAALDAKEASEKLRLAAVNLKSKQKEIFSTAADPIGGNPDGDVSVAVFFDYACGYCKKTLPKLNTLLANDRSLRVVYKEFPILGPQSEKAARAALAAGRQGKYVAFHNALIESADISDETIKAIAATLQLNYEVLLKDMKDPALEATIASNYELANALDINGTPAYVIDDQIIPGAIDSASLAKIVEAHRAKNKNVAPVGASR